MLEAETDEGVLEIVTIDEAHDRYGFSPFPGGPRLDVDVSRLGERSVRATERLFAETPNRIVNGEYIVS